MELARRNNRAVLLVELRAALVNVLTAAGITARIVAQVRKLWRMARRCAQFGELVPLSPAPSEHHHDYRSCGKMEEADRGRVWQSHPGQRAQPGLARKAARTRWGKEGGEK